MYCGAHIKLIWNYWGYGPIIEDINESFNIEHMGRDKVHQNRSLPTWDNLGTFQKGSISKTIFQQTSHKYLKYHSDLFILSMAFNFMFVSP